MLSDVGHSKGLSAQHVVACSAEPIEDFARRSTIHYFAARKSGDLGRAYGEPVLLQPKPGWGQPRIQAC